VNTAWTEEQTKESVRRQIKALYIAIPIIVILLIALFSAAGYILHHWFMYPPEYYKEIEQLVERGYLSKDYTTIEYLDFCENIEPTLGDTYSYVCVWID
tara:strand:+ start:286 stop:582 length:297 start_codon:yes stop_codon:yes gene_type:complete